MNNYYYDKKQHKYEFSALYFGFKGLAKLIEKRNHKSVDENNIFGVGLVYIFIDEDGY